MKGARLYDKSRNRAPAVGAIPGYHAELYRPIKAAAAHHSTTGKTTAGQTETETKAKLETASKIYPCIMPPDCKVIRRLYFVELYAMRHRALFLRSAGFICPHGIGIPPQATKRGKMHCERSGTYRSTTKPIDIPRLKTTACVLRCLAFILRPIDFVLV